MTRRPISIQDIARAAGVSHSTVSRALHNSPLISADVRDQIRRLADEMGYTPNAIAQSLQMRRSNTVGLVVTTIADPFWSDVVKGVEEVARQSGVSVFLSAAYADPDQELAAIETLHRRRVDGVLVADAHLNSAHTARLQRMRVPTVLINSQVDGPANWFHSVSVDDEYGARQAVEYLLQQGHRAIGYLGVANRPRSHSYRLSAYRDTLADAGIADRAEWVAVAASPMTDDVAAGEALAPRLLDAGVTAIFCYNDMLAIGALLACHARKLKVPDDVSIVGFDDIQAAQFVTPALTTIHQPKVRLGMLAMHMLLDLLAEREVRNEVVTPRLVVRESTATNRSANRVGV